MDLHMRSSAATVIVAGAVCAGVVWASLGLAERLRRPEATGTRIAADAKPDAASPAFVRRRTDAAAPPMLAVSAETQTYSMSSPVFLADPSADHAYSIAVGDVTGDERDDLVFLSVRSAANPIDNRTEVYVARQRYDGQLDAAIKIGDSGSNLSYQLLTADLDGDGTDEIITATLGGVMVFRSNGNGTYASNTTPAGSPQDIVVTDVDRDGRLDILVDSSDTSATVLHGDGHGGIARTSTLPLPASAVRTTGDVTGDGLDDLVLATIFNRPLQEFRIYPALASGGYGSPVVLSRPVDANQTSALAIGDFNGDGRGDLAMDEARDGANLHLYFQDAQGNLSTPLDVARQPGSGVLIATDLNRDGRTDLAMAHSGWGYIGYYLQTSAGLTPENIVNAYQYMGRANYFATGDLNHDGCGDLAISRSSSQSPVVLYGQGCGPRRHIAICRLPPVPVSGTGVVAAGRASPRARQRDSDAAASPGESLTRGAGVRARRR